MGQKKNLKGNVLVETHPTEITVCLTFPKLTGKPAHNVNRLTEECLCDLTIFLQRP